MAERLARALEGFRYMPFANAFEDPNLRKKDSMETCAFMVDLLVSPKYANSHFPHMLCTIIETLIYKCDDKDSDIRMVAEESLNKIIRGMSEPSMLKIQVELHREIKKNGPARCLRTALWKFGQMSCFIRPSKGRGHVGNLIPYIIEICNREEESIHETLAGFTENTFKVIGVFMQDNDIKVLLKRFFHNLSSDNAVIRRSAASSVNSTVKYCRKTHVFNSYALNQLLDRLVPVNEENSSSLVIGIFGCLRLLLTNLRCDKNDEGISGSFGLRKKKDKSLLSVDRLIQVYELCLHYSKSKDHNVVTAALETLNQLLQNPPQELYSFLLSPSGFGRSYIHYARENEIRSRSGSEMNISCSISGDESLLIDDTLSFHLRSSLVPSCAESKQSKSRGSAESAEEEVKIVESPFKDKLLGDIFGDQLTASFDDSDNECSSSRGGERSREELNPSPPLLEIGPDTIKPLVFKKYSRADSRDDLCTNVEEEDVFGNETIVDVGAFTDSEIPLIYCARHVAASFLLGGTKTSLKPDKTVRVSIKSLALNCISAIIKLYPRILTMDLAKNNTEVHNQEMREILLLADHSDPQIRGNICVLVINFINAVLLDSKGFNCEWLGNENDSLSIDNMLSLLSKGLKDDATTCSRQALSGLKLAAKTIFTVQPEKMLPILNFIPSLVTSPYWLVRVRLVDLLAELPFLCLNELTSSNHYEEKILEDVMFPLLGDDDARVRTAAAESITKMIPHLYYGNSTLLTYSKEFTIQMKKCLKSKKDESISGSHLNPFPPFCYHARYNTNSDFDLNIEGSLSRIIARLTSFLLKTRNHLHVFGCLEALKLLSEKYPPTVYVNAWNCSKNKSSFEELELINILLTHLVTFPVSYDLGAVTCAMVVLGNVFAGQCISNIKANHQVALSPGAEPRKYWAALKTKQLSSVAERIFTHALKVLNIYNHLLEDTPPIKGPASSATSNLFSLGSPIKRQERRRERDRDKSEERKQKQLYLLRQTYYYKLYQLVKLSHHNYKISLENSAGEKFLNLLDSTLDVLCILLELGTVHDTGRCAEEILSYLKQTISLRPSKSVQCGIQLLKSLFGTNLALNWEFKNAGGCENLDHTLYANIYQSPSESFFNSINSHSVSTSLESENLAGSRRRTDSKIQNANKSCLATYIRLFEPMLIKSLQLYTITNDVILQSNVFKLLNHLIQLRVNYCLLDSDEIFFNFVIKQFELIEHGQIPGIEKLLPEIFKFLILLSYEKRHSKTITTIPKILHLCDALMASNQPTQTHCIPALVPIVDDVFLSRNVISCPRQQKELETQREVVLAMLLRLVEFPEVMNMLTLILNESRTLEEREKWKRWSRQVIDAILPLAPQDKLHIDSFEGQESFNKLLASLSPNVLRPIDPLLKILFVEPNDYDCPLLLKRWISRVTVILETIFHVKEDVLLCRLEEVSPNINLSTFVPVKKIEPEDPFHVQSSFPKYEPAETFARFLLKVISVTGFKILESISTSSHIQQQLSIYFLCVFHILKSGTFHRVSNSLQTLLTTERDLVSQICSMFINMTNFAPVLSCQFSYFLAILNYFDKSYWTKILSAKNTLSSKLVQHCSVISLCDYLCEVLSDTDTLGFLLSKNIKEVTLLSNETPIKELLTTIQKRPESTLLMEAIESETMDGKDPQYMEKLLRILEIANNSHSGFVLYLLVKKFILSPYLAVSRLASLLACRRAEYILALPREEVPNHLKKDRFLEIINVMNNKNLTKRHYALVGLLNKLCTEVYDVPAIELAEARVLDPKELKVIQLDEDWYAKQIKERCSQESYSGYEIAGLLGTLNYDKITEIMSSPNFNIEILKDCLQSLDLIRKRSILDSPSIPEESGPRNQDLYKASKSFILKSISDLVRKLEINKSIGDASEGKEDVKLYKLTEDETFYLRIWQFAPAVIKLMDLIGCEGEEIETDYVESLMDFGLIILEVLNHLSKEEVTSEKLTSFTLNQEILENGLTCCISVLRNRQVGHLISQSLNIIRLRSCIKNAFGIVKYLIPQTGDFMCSILERPDILEEPFEYDELRLIHALCVFVIKGLVEILVPSYVENIIGDLTICICEIPAISTHILKAPENRDLQDIELFENFILTFSKIKWTSRQQFEKIWVTLLAVLGCNSEKNVSIEENNLAVQASTTAVEGITVLLKSTMINAVTKKILHHGRDSFMMKNIVDKLPLLAYVDPKDQFGDRSYHFLDNLEISKLTDRYHHGLLSVEYIWTAVQQINNDIELLEKHTNYINSIGLDVTSCVHLLMELYSQWMYQTTPDIRLITSCLKSSIAISDLFTDIAQFQWLLDICLKIESIVITENTVILPLLIVGCCKAVAVVLPDPRMCEKVKRLMLHSRSVPCRIAAMQGLLYLLQSPVVNSAASHPQKSKDSSPTEEVNFVKNIVDMFLPIAIDIFRDFRIESLPGYEEYDRCFWSLMFYLLQHYQPQLGEYKDELLEFILIELSRKTCSETIRELLVRGIERLLLTSVIDDFFKEQVSRVALDITGYDSFRASRCGLQLLMILSFLEKRAKDIRLLVTGQEDPEKIMKDMEKINVLFDKLKKSYPEEAEIIGFVISYILVDFSASDILTKVIQEFLSSNQPHLKILSGLLFKVFERAELTLLVDWVVFSLPSLIQGLPVGMSVWTLNCFFVSASNETWLRSLFPLVQSRIRMAEEEDVKLLCLAASHFYKQLKDEKQKKLFVETFENAAQTHSVYSDLLATLS